MLQMEAEAPPYRQAQNLVFCGQFKGEGISVMSQLFLLQEFKLKLVVSVSLDKLAT